MKSSPKFHRFLICVVLYSSMDQFHTHKVRLNLVPEIFTFLFSPLSSSLFLLLFISFSNNIKDPRMDILKKKQTQKDYSCILFFFFFKETLPSIFAVAFPLNLLRCVWESHAVSLLSLSSWKDEWGASLLVIPLSGDTVLRCQISVCCGSSTFESMPALMLRFHFPDLHKVVSQNWKVTSDFLWPVDCSPPGSSAYGILQARILE